MDKYAWFCRQAWVNLKNCDPDTESLDQARFMLRVMKRQLAGLKLDEEADEDPPVGKR